MTIAKRNNMKTANLTTENVIYCPDCGERHQWDGDDPFLCGECCCIFDVVQLPDAKAEDVRRLVKAARDALSIMSFDDGNRLRNALKPFEEAK